MLMDMPSMLEVKNITKSFGGVRAIQGSNFIIEKGKITALIGPNGAGKTTLFNIITGYLKPDTGSVSFCGTEITKQDPHNIANSGISRTFQQVRLFKYLTIYDHLRMTDDNEDTKLLKQLFLRDTRDRNAYEVVLEEFGIDRELDALASELSYGQRKLLDLAMAMRKPHELLMLDEPVAGVNHVVQTRIEQTLLRLKQENETILIIDHDMDFVRRLADHVIVLDDGVVLTEGNPETVLCDERVLEAYLGI